MAEVREVVVLPRVPRSAPATSEPGVVPANATTVTVRVDMDAVDLLDPGKTLTVVLERDLGAGRWESLGSFLMTGTAVRLVSRHPHLVVRAPVPGTLLRARLVPGARSVDTGVIVEVE